jgi:hypothetical protein
VRIITVVRVLDGGCAKGPRRYIDAHAPGTAKPSMAKCQVYVQVAALPLRLTAHQLLYFALLGTTCVLTGFQRIFRFVLLARGAFGFLAFFLG